MDAPHPIQLCNILTALRRNDIEPQGAFGIAEASRGMFWMKMAHPQKVPSFKKGPKEDERVALRPFHKRVDESEIFGTSGSKNLFLFPRYSCLKKKVLV